MEISRKLSKGWYYRSSKQSLKTICVFIKYVCITNMLYKSSLGFVGVAVSSYSDWLEKISSVSEEMLYYQV